MLQVINEAFGIPGVILAVASLVMFSFVTPTVKKSGQDTSSGGRIACSSLTCDAGVDRRWCLDCDRLVV